MDLSIVILTWNSENYIERCVRSIITSMPGISPSYEILVVDNGSTDKTADLLKRLSLESPGRILVQFLQSNLGTTASRNMALKEARGKYVCVMDSDVEVDSGVFAALIWLLNDDLSVGLAVPKIYYPSGLVQKSCDRFPTLLHKVNRLFRLRSIELQEAVGQDLLTENVMVDYAISAFWLFRSDLLATVGFLDERIFYSPEDVDYCLRIWKAGYRIIYVPTHSVIHHTQEISRGWKVNRFKVSHFKGLVYLFAKHRYFFKIPDFKTAHGSRREEVSLTT